MTDKGSKKPSTRLFEDSDVSSSEIHEQVDHILNSKEFNATDAQRSFLQYVVEKTLAGQAQEIKGYTVATEVFGRGVDFDQNIDPIVSIQANKLRRALERYYFTAGINDPLRIDIPKGTYVPTFTHREAAEPDKPVTITRVPEIETESKWPTILVRPFKYLATDSDEHHLSIGIATELAVELSKYQDFSVILQDPAGSGRRISDTGVRFVIDGTIRNVGSGIRLSLYMMDAVSGTQLWGETHRCELDASSLAAFEEKVAQIVAVKVAGEYGIISYTLSQETKIKPPSELKTYEALLSFYEFDLLLTSESFTRALDALEYAATIEPGCGQVWTKLGRLYATMYALEMPGFETALEKAVASAQKGVQLNPDNQRARSILGLVRMFSNELKAALKETEKALALNPNCLFMIDGIGYLLMLLGEWDRGRALIKKATTLNPYHGLYVHYALWVDWIRQQKYIQADLETLNFCRPTVFWEPLMKSATSGLLDRIDEGRKAAQDLLSLKPDFAARGRTLIRNYIKFDDIVDRVISGLCKVGLTVD